MKMISRLVKTIKSELHDAEKYTNLYYEIKSTGGNDLVANQIKTIAEDELRHAEIIHEKAEMDIEKLKAIYSPSDEMLKMWNDEHKEYIAKFDSIKKMLK